MKTYKVKHRKGLLSFFLAIFVFSCYAQENIHSSLSEDSIIRKNDNIKHVTKYGLRTNVLSLLTLTPHIEFDFFMNRHWDLSVGGAYGWWGFTGDQHALQSWKVLSELRYYFKTDVYSGHSFGARIEGGQFDFRLKEDGKRGSYVAAGITYAYTWLLGKNKLWHIDAGIGGGYLYTDYTKYQPYKPTHCYHRIYDKKESKLGLTHLFINLGYRFPVEKKGAGR